MEIKKSPKADLQNKRMLFLLLGLVVALGITGLAFSLSSKPEAGEYTPPKRETTEMEQIDNTRQDQMETPPEPQKAQAHAVEDLDDIAHHGVFNVKQPPQGISPPWITWYTGAEK